LEADADVRLLELHHAPDLFGCIVANRDHLKPWLTWADSTQDVADVRAFISEALQQFSHGLGFHAGLFVASKPVGGIGFHPIDWPNRKASLGYWIAAEYQGRGLVSKAVHAAVTHAFSDWSLNRIEIRCATDNRRSRAVPERLGFTEEGVRRQYEFMHGRYRDLVVYTIFAEEWLSRH
jgi:ribosomal-protein-serine acetyltransferase